MNTMSELLLRTEITTPKLQIGLPIRPRSKGRQKRRNNLLQLKPNPTRLEICPKLKVKKVLFILSSFPNGFDPPSNPDDCAYYESVIDIQGVKVELQSRAMVAWDQHPIFAPLQIPKSFLGTSNLPFSSGTFKILVKELLEGSIFTVDLEENVFPLLGTYSYGNLKVTIFDGTQGVKYLRNGLNPQVQIAVGLLSRAAQEEASAHIYAQCKLVFLHNFYFRHIGDLETRSVLVTENGASIPRFFGCTDKTESSSPTTVAEFVEKRVLRKWRRSGDNENIGRWDPKHGDICVYFTTAFTEPGLIDDINNVLKYNPDAFFLILDLGQKRPSEEDHRNAISHLLKDDYYNLNHVIIPIGKLGFCENEKTKLQSDLIQAFVDQIADWMGFAIARMGQKEERRK